MNAQTARVLKVAKRRTFLQQIMACAGLGLVPASLAWATTGQRGDQELVTRIAAAWRGPDKSDPHFAGILQADWVNRRVSILSSTRLPTRPHGLFPEPDGNLLVVGVRPGAWMMRVDSAGQIVAQQELAQEAGMCRLNGHAIWDARGAYVLSTETDFQTGRGVIGVRDRQTLKKLDQWDSHGLEPHQLILGPEGDLYVANGGIPRTLSDKKIDLHRMDSALVRLDGQTGELRRRWVLDDRRLSLRHLAWSRLQKPTAQLDQHLLGVAMQAEHELPSARAKAPVLAVLVGDELLVPEAGSDPAGYAGDIAPAFSGGFALSSNVSSVARVWHPGLPEKLSPIVELPEAYALTHSGQTGGVLVATAPGLVRWHPTEKPVFLAWPQHMALDNHWVNLG